MEDNGLCDGRNIKLLLLVEFMHEDTVIVATTVLFLPIYRDFYVLIKQREWNTHYNMYMRGVLISLASTY